MLVKVGWFMLPALHIPEAALWSVAYSGEAVSAENEDLKHKTRGKLSAFSIHRYQQKRHVPCINRIRKEIYMMKLSMIQVFITFSVAVLGACGTEEDLDLQGYLDSDAITQNAILSQSLLSRPSDSRFQISGGDFSSGRGWQVVNTEDMIKVDMGHSIAMGSAEVDVTNFNPPVQGRDRGGAENYMVIFAMMGEDKAHDWYSTTHGWEVLTFWNEAVEGDRVKKVKLATWGSGVIKAQTMAKLFNWASGYPDHVFNIKATWGAAGATLTVADKTQAADNIGSASLTVPWTPSPIEPRYVYVGLNKSASDAAVGPIYSNLKVVEYADSVVTAVSIDMQDTDVVDGLSRPSPEPTDGQTIAATVSTCNANSVRLRKNSSGQYMYFRVDDSFIARGSYSHVSVSIQYWNNLAANSLRLQYDSSPTAHYKPTGTTVAGSSNCMKTVTYELSDAYFGNGQNGQADFRIECGGTCYVNMVTVTKK